MDSKDQTGNENIFIKAEVMALKDTTAPSDQIIDLLLTNFSYKMPESTRSRKYLYLTVFSGNLFAFITGLSVTWSSPMIPKLQNGTLPDNPFGRDISIAEASWIGAFYALGGIFGPLLAGYVLTKFGRKSCTIFCGGIPFSVAFLTVAFSETIYLYYVARFFIGIAASSIYTVVPMYNGEIAEPAIRGKICSSISTFETFGELLSYVLGPLLSIFWYNTLIGSVAIFSTVLGFIILPESPFYLISKNDYLGARKSLIKLRSTNPEGVKEELELILSTLEESKLSQGSTRDILKSKPLRRAQLTILGLLGFQLSSGIIPILFYSQSIFKEGGDVIPPEYCAMAIGVTEFISSLITPHFVDRLGRKPMLVISALGMFVSEFTLGLYFFLKYYSYNTEAFYWLPVVCLVGYIFSYIVGFGPLLWTVMGEIFPPNMKSSATTLTCFIYWVLVFIMSKLFNFISDPIGIAICFWIFAGSCLLSVVFVLTYMIETKGKSFHEIQILLNR